ncbi:MAG: DUF4375 domain-containing protein [Cyclobacteriaceae bacterium]
MELFDFQDKWEKLVDKSFSKGYGTLTDSERVWFNVQTLIQDVDNGGLISHYYNSGADTILDTIEDLKKLGADDIVYLIRQMNDLFPNSTPPKDIDKRNEIINSLDSDGLDERLTKLDNEFYSKEKDLELKLVDHILQNRLG